MRYTLPVFLAALLSTAILNAQPCPVTCPTADDVAVQAQLDAVAAAGGGTVQLDPRVYRTCAPLVLGSNTHLRGASRGATIIRGAAGSITQKTISNTGLRASIGGVGVSNATVSDLTVDHFTCGRSANGVAFMPASLSSSGDLDGQVSTNILIERIEVSGKPGIHNYMIWNMKSRHIKILNNFVQGNTTLATAGAPQEGIESFGGYDVLIQGNTVENIGYACITFGSGVPIVGSESNGIRVVDNHVQNCSVGVNVSTSLATGEESSSHSLVARNVIRDVTLAGVDVPVSYGNYERDLQIVGNSIRGVNGSVNGTAGIRLRSNDSRPLGDENVIGTLVEGNFIEHVTAANGLGVYLLQYPNARILNNTIIDTASDGVYAYNSADVEIAGNRIERSGTHAIGVYRSPLYYAMRFVVERNLLRDWASNTSAIAVTGGHFGTVKDNVLARFDTATPGVLSVDSATCSVTISGNVPWYYPVWVPPSVAACP